MQTYYKYTSNFGIEYLENPTIKISNTRYLNDPFESQTGDNLIQVMVNALIRNGKDTTHDLVKNILDHLLNANGIFSVSETPRNPLMWAHYANEHSGLCIGFDGDIFSSEKITDEPKYSIAALQPMKINYDNYRFDRQNEINYRDEVYSSVRKHLLTKSDEWIYEKEHRWIVPFYFSTYITINEKSKNNKSLLTEDYCIEEYINDAIADKCIVKEDENIYKIVRNPDLTYAALSSFGCVNFIYKVNPKNIKSIHIGLRVSNEDVIDIYEKINEKDSKLSHVKLFKFKLSSKRFELLPDVVDEKYIENLKDKPMEKDL